MPSLNMSSLGEYIREQREQAEVSLRQLARTAGVSNPYLSQVERGLKRPSAEILQQIAQGLRISAETLYVRAGLLEARDGERTPTVAAAVLSDPVLTHRQKRTLLDVYDAFCRENAPAPPAVSPPTTPPAAVTPRKPAPRKTAARTTAVRKTAAREVTARKAVPTRAAVKTPHTSA
jgi:transcriptional regulator with XRE-family HTH domain